METKQQHGDEMKTADEIGVPNDNTWWWCGVFSKDEALGWYDTLARDLTEEGGTPEGNPRADAGQRASLRTAAKRHGWAAMRDETKTLGERVNGYLTVLVAHWLRSWESSGFSPLHPRYRAYLRVCADRRGAVPDEVWAVFVDKYAPVPSVYMPAGRSYFNLDAALAELREVTPDRPLAKHLRSMGGFGLVNTKLDGKQSYLPLVGIVGDVAVCASWCGRYKVGFGLHDLRMLGQVWLLPGLPCVRVSRTAPASEAAVPWTFGETEIVQKSDLANEAGEREYSYIPPAGTPAAVCYEQAAHLGFPYGDAPKPRVMS